MEGINQAILVKGIQNRTNKKGIYQNYQFDLFNIKDMEEDRKRMKSQMAQRKNIENMTLSERLQHIQTTL